MSFSLSTLYLTLCQIRRRGPRKNGASASGGVSRRAVLRHQRHHASGIRSRYAASRVSAVRVCESRRIRDTAPRRSDHIPHV